MKTTLIIWFFYFAIMQQKTKYTQPFVVISSTFLKLVLELQPLLITLLLFVVIKVPFNYSEYNSCLWAQTVFDSDSDQNNKLLARLCFCLVIHYLLVAALMDLLLFYIYDAQI